MISRAAVLRGRWRPTTEALPPPWARADSFAARCDGCGDCVTACAEGIIAAGDGGYPEVDFRRGACTFCGACVEACPTGALAHHGQAAWSAAARITASCLSFRGTSCRLCEEHCEPRAIRFRPLPGGRALPEVDIAACTACGACLAVCPAEAVTIRRVGP